MIADWTELAIGIILIISPWVLGFSDISLAKWGNIVLGLALVLWNAWTIFNKSFSAPPPAMESSAPTPQKRIRKIKNNVEQKIK